jgi:hypothetical protein
LVDYEFTYTSYKKYCLWLYNYENGADANLGVYIRQMWRIR